MNSNSVLRVTKKTNIADLVSKFPEVGEVLMSFGLHCVGCMASQFDTIEEGAEIHGMLDEEVDEMINEINRVIKDSERRSKDIVKIGKIEIDRDLCIGAGPCEVLAPKTFKVDANGKAILLDERGNTDEEIIDAAKSCPVFAIRIYDTKGKLIYPT